MSAGQESGSPIRENRTLLPAPLPPDEARGTLAAAAGVSTVGLRPPFDTPAAAFSSRLSRHSHLDCRARWPGRRADIEARRLIHAFYQGFLRREPDPPGLESHVTALIAGRSAADIAEEFLACAEFKAPNVKLFVPPGH